MGEAIESHRRRFLSAFPHAEVLEDVLRTPANPTPLFFFARAQDEDLKNCWWVLGRLGKDLEQQFSVASEVLLLFTPYQDLQRRTFNALAERLRDECTAHQRAVFGNVRFSPDPTLSFVAAPDPSAPDKLDAWNLEGGASLVALLPDRQREPGSYRDSLLESISRVIGSRDLYRGRNPVTGTDFFGRQEMLKNLRSELFSGRSVGLFGLRRSGKTSVLREFQRRFEKTTACITILDLEDAGDLGNHPAQMSAAVLDSLRRLKQDETEIWIGAESEQIASTPAEFSQRMSRLAARNPGVRFVLCIDEIESLNPIIRQDPIAVRRFLGCLRSCAQSADNVALLITGVTAKYFWDSFLGDGIENPLFGFVEELFLPPFSEYETANLVRSLGRRMLLQWNDDALAALHAAAGGYPPFVRDLASAARGVAVELEPRQPGHQIIVTEEIVAAAVPQWIGRSARLWGEIIRALGEHHPVLGELVRCRTTDEVTEWLELADDPMTVRHAMVSLGLMVAADEGVLQPSRSLEALQRLDQRQVGSETDRIEALRQRRAAGSSLVEQIRSGEGGTLEFKASLRWDHRTLKVNKDLQRPVAKTVAAFANTDGGRLLIGIDDDGQVVGLGADLQSLGNLDRFERTLTQTLDNCLGSALVARLVRVSFNEVDGETVAVVDVQRSDRAVWLSDGDNDEFYVRSGAKSVPLRPRDVHPHLASTGRAG